MSSAKKYTMSSEHCASDLDKHILEGVQKGGRGQITGGREKVRGA